MLVTTISWSELSGNLADRMLQSFHDRTAFPGTHDQGRGGDHAIADRSDDHTFGKASFGDPLRDVRFGREGQLLLLVRDQLDAEHESEAPNVPDDCVVH